MKKVDKTVLGKLLKPDPDSHKTQNGRVLIIAGSDKYHGAMVLAIQAASRIVDMVYVYSAPKNHGVIKGLKNEIATFITVLEDELWSTVDLVDSILVGPGLEENKKTMDITEKLLTDFKHKKLVVDATSLWHVDPNLLHENVMVTPHSREFENVFECNPGSENVFKMAEKYHTNIVLKGKLDYISDGKKLWENQTGNVGMTKGGTGDVLAGIAVAFAAKNNCIDSALAATYLNGLAGDKLYEKVGIFYNASDLVRSVGDVWKKN